MSTSRRRGRRASRRSSPAAVDQALAGEQISPAAAPWTLLLPGAEGDAGRRAGGAAGRRPRAAGRRRRRLRQRHDGRRRRVPADDGALRETGAVDVATATGARRLRRSGGRRRPATATPPAAVIAHHRGPPRRGRRAAAAPAGGPAAGRWLALAAAAAGRRRGRRAGPPARVVARRAARRRARVHPAAPPHRSVADLRRAGQLPPAPGGAGRRLRPRAGRARCRPASGSETPSAPCRAHAARRAATCWTAPHRTRPSEDAHGHRCSTPTTGPPAAADARRDRRTRGGAVTTIRVTHVGGPTTLIEAAAGGCSPTPRSTPRPALLVRVGHVVPQAGRPRARRHRPRRPRRSPGQPRPPRRQPRRRRPWPAARRPGGAHHRAGRSAWRATSARRRSTAWPRGKRDAWRPTGRRRCRSRRPRAGTARRGSRPIVGDVVGFALRWEGQEHGAAVDHRRHRPLRRRAPGARAASTRGRWSSTWAGSGSRSPARCATR